MPGSPLPDIGEPLLRKVYRETSLEVEHEPELVLHGHAHAGSFELTPALPSRRRRGPAARG